MSESGAPHSQPDVADFSIGSIVFDRFQVLGEIASGAKGRVYKAQDTLLQTTVALKVLLADHNNRDLMRFQSEARLASKMKHPGIATIFDFGIFGNTPFLSMEFVEGQSLDSYLEEHHTISILEMCEIFLQVCAAMDHAHAGGIVHRDIKPANIVISRNDDGTVRAKILDFGVAKNLDIVEEQGGKLTPTGNLVGSPNYMSPEQCRGEKVVTTKSDNYSVGCVMWNCLAGKPPFDADSVMEVLAMHANVEPEKFSTVVDVPEQLATLIDELLSKNPEERPDLKLAVMPVLEELREELNLTFREESDDEDTTIGAQDEPTLIDSLRNRVDIAVGLGLAMLALVGVFVYHMKSTTSEKFAGVPIPSRTDVRLQTDIMADVSIKKMIEDVRNGRANKLSITYISYSEQVLEECAGLPALQRLDVSDTPVSDSETRFFVRIPNLNALFLNRTRMATLDGFEALKKVSHIELKNTKITNDSLKNLAKMPSLNQLIISNNDISDDGIKSLTPLKNLNQLDLADTKITSKCVPYIKSFPKLRVLSLNKTNITETAIREIASMRSLEFFTLEECKAVDATTLEALKEDFPEIAFENSGALLPNTCRECAIALNKGNYKTAYVKIHKILKMLESGSGTDSKLLASNYNTQAFICLNLGKYDEAEKAIAKVSSYAERAHDNVLRMSVLETQAAIATHRGETKKLIGLFEKLSKIQDQETGPTSNIAITRLITVGNTYKDSLEFAKALRIFDSASARLRSSKNPSPDLIRMVQLQHAECFRMLKRTSEAAAIYEKLNEELESSAQLSDVGTSLLFSGYAGFGAIKAEKGDIQSGLAETDKMVQLLKTGKISLEHQQQLWYQRGEYLRILGRAEESKACAVEFARIKAELAAKK